MGVVGHRCNTPAEQPFLGGEILEHKHTQTTGLIPQTSSPTPRWKDTKHWWSNHKIKIILMFSFGKSLMGKAQNNKSHVYSQALQGKGQPVISLSPKEWTNPALSFRLKNKNFCCLAAALLVCVFLSWWDNPEGIPRRNSISTFPFFPEADLFHRITPPAHHTVQNT